jgi:hypothetical protein
MKKAELEKGLEKMIEDHINKLSNLTQEEVVECMIQEHIQEQETLAEANLKYINLLK